MKPFLLILTFIFCSLSFYGQNIPTGYYDNATGSGYSLKSQLHEITRGSLQAKSYSALWSLYEKIENGKSVWQDQWYENDKSVLDMYSEAPNSKDPYIFTLKTDRCGSYKKEGDCYNREHIIPQSTFKKQSPMVSDAFHIWPTDGKVNAWRSNHPHGIVEKKITTPCNSSANNKPCHSQNGSKIGYADPTTGYSGIVFEPVDEFKGDIARAYFYFATCYENSITSWNYAMFNKNKNQVFTDAFKNILLQWHEMDPVSPREIAINEAIYKHQNNRNPFIDHPEWVKNIWGNSSSSNTINEKNLNKEYQPREFIEVYPSISENKRIFVEYKGKEAKIMAISIFNINGNLLKTFTNSSSLEKIELTIDQPDVYVIKILGNNFEVNRKVIIK